MSINFQDQVGCTPREYLGNFIKSTVKPYELSEEVDLLDSMHVVPPIGLMVASAYLLAGRFRDMTKAAKWGFGLGVVGGGIAAQTSIARLAVRKKQRELKRESISDSLRQSVQHERLPFNPGILLLPTTFLLAKWSPISFPRVSWTVSRLAGFTCGVGMTYLVFPLFMRGSDPWRDEAFGKQESEERLQALGALYSEMAELNIKMMQQQTIPVSPTGRKELVSTPMPSDRFLIRIEGITGARVATTLWFHQTIRAFEKDTGAQLGTIFTSPEKRWGMVKSQYRTSALALHPDKNPTYDGELFRRIGSEKALIEKLYTDWLQPMEPPPREAPQSQGGRFIEWHPPAES